MKQKSVLISGAGVAGLSLAYWLKRFGFVPVLIEKHPCLRTGGYKIDLRGAGLEVIKRMGVYPAVSESRTKNHRGIVLDEIGRPMMEMSVDLLGTRREDFDLEIMRTTLCHILNDAAGEVECIFDDCIQQICNRDDSVDVEFAKHPPRTFDLVIGADGLHSKVRQLVFGEESRFSKNLGIFVSVWTCPDFLHLNDCEVEQHTHQRFVNIYRDRKNSKATVAIAFSSSEFRHSHEVYRERLKNWEMPRRRPEFGSGAAGAEAAKLKKFSDAGGSQNLWLSDAGRTDSSITSGIKDQQKLISEIFADSKWEVFPKILEAMEDNPDFYFDSMAQIHMPCWTKGRVALVGDAAYSATPLSGQGTSIAIAGAYVLAGELFEACGDPGIAFSRYEEMMRPFIQENQALADMSLRIMKDSLYSRWLYRIGSLMPGRMVDYFKKRSLKQTTKAANALKVKDYEKNR